MEATNARPWVRELPSGAPSMGGGEERRANGHGTIPVGPEREVPPSIAGSPSPVPPPPNSAARSLQTSEKTFGSAREMVKNGAIPEVETALPIPAVGDGDGAAALVPRLIGVRDRDPMEPKVTINARNSALAAKAKWKSVCDEIDAYIDSTPDLASNPELKSFRITLDKAITWALAKLASADGSVTEPGAQIIGLITGNNSGAAAYNAGLAAAESTETIYDLTVTVLRTAMQIHVNSNLKVH